MTRHAQCCWHTESDDFTYTAQKYLSLQVHSDARLYQKTHNDEKSEDCIFLIRRIIVTETLFR